MKLLLLVFTLFICASGTQLILEPDYANLGQSTIENKVEEQCTGAIELFTLSGQSKRYVHNHHRLDTAIYHYRSSDSFTIRANSRRSRRPITISGIKTHGTCCWRVTDKYSRKTTYYGGQEIQINSYVFHARKCDCNNC